MKLEICIESLSSAQAALAGGADRLEVCGALSCGGTTPSLSLVEQCRELPGSKIMMMIRPHAKSFVYGREEFHSMLGDIRMAKQLDVQGVVFGALKADGTVDKELCRKIIDAARPLEITFHRAFDLALDPVQALDDLIDLGVDRVLTSGQSSTAMDGAAMLKRLVHQAGRKLSVIVAGGVRAENIQQLLSTGATEFHSSARKLTSMDLPLIGQLIGQLGSSSSRGQAYEVDEAQVSAMALAIHRAG